MDYVETTHVGWSLHKKTMDEANTLRNQVAVLREALATIKYHAKDTPSDFDISVIQNTADKALEDK